MRFDTTNGGVKLQDVGGRVNGATRNGGLNVTLSGDRWDGEGLDVETSNGGVTLAIPDGYNAELETRTVNGGLRIDFPITVQGELTSRRGISDDARIRRPAGPRAHHQRRREDRRVAASNQIASSQK